MSTNEQGPGAGTPVAGAVIWAWTWTGNMYWGQTAFLGTATSEETGTASFGALPQGYYRLWARAPDGMQADAMRQVVVGHGTSRVRMNVMRPRHARVRVVNDADPAQGVAGVRVTRNIAFWLEDVVHSLYVDLPEPVPLTSSDGETVVTGLPADRGIELVVGAPGPVVRQRCTPGDPTTTIVVPAPLRIEVQACCVSASAWTAGPRSPRLLGGTRARPWWWGPRWIEQPPR